ncbi:hypothetical protein GAYE_SCF53G6114 [Galdieria yellowstonensis]|uniref:Cell cycle checkpoint protein RAD1 n=1 Tax=Galdieria yellowstonensis TaxID=3028027 RepID=A0AAV9ILP7_9RHOD|nr:hypothetical protein GAYE_SCF53G6114 [Galdieria yellowstonensis]
MEDQRDAYLSFSLTGETPRVFFEALTCLCKNFGRTKKLVLWVSHAPRGGLKLVVEEESSFQASVLIRHNGFETLDVSENFDGFSVFLTDLIDGLSILGVTQNAQYSVNQSRASVLRVVQAAKNEPLHLILHDPDFVTQCRLKTVQAEAPVDFSFFASTVICSAIVASEVFREALQELDVVNTEALKISVKRDSLKPTLILQGVNRDGTTDAYGGFVGMSICVEFPPPLESNEVFAEFHVTDDFKAGVFPMNLVRRCVRALSFSDTCRLRVNRAGVLSIVIRFRTCLKTLEHSETPSSYCFLEYLICPFQAS